MPKSATSKYAAGRNAELLKALTHPLKARILVALDETQATPTEVAQRLGEDFRTVARLMREMKNTDPPLLAEVGMRRVRGGVAHVYKLIGRPVLDLGPWESMPRLLREVHSTEAGRIILGDLAEAIQAGTFDARPERTMVRDVVILDEEGLGEVEEAGAAYVQAIAESAARSAGRLAESGEKGIRISASALAFEVP